MAVTLVSSLVANKESAGVSSRTFTMPTVQTDDIIVISFHAHTISTASVSGLGWTDQTAPADAISTRSGSSCYVWTKKLVAADSGTMVTLKSTFSKGVTIAAIYRGATSVSAYVASTPSASPVGAFTPTAYVPSAGTHLVQAITNAIGDLEVLDLTAPNNMVLRGWQNTGGSTSRVAGGLADLLTQNTAAEGQWATDKGGYWTAVNVELKGPAVVPLATPSVTVTKVDPTTFDGTNGSITATINSAVPGAVGYRFGKLPGSVLSGADPGETQQVGLTKTWSNQSAGTYTVTVQAV